MNHLNKILFSILVFSAAGLHAATRSVNEALAVAKKTLSNSSVVSLTQVKVDDGDTVFYSFKGNAGGYVIVDANSESSALLAYCKDYAGSELPSELQGMLNCFSKNTERLKTDGNNVLKAYRITNAPIEPLLGNTCWGQKAPFNNACPNVGVDLAPTGCVATAVAQIMRYYKHPAAVVADIPAYVSKINKISRPAVKKGTVIDWKNILDNYNEGYTDVQADAVAQLMSIVGTAANMDYDKNESASNKIMMSELVNYFGFDPDFIQLARRTTYSLKEWYDIIYNELKEKRPVMMAGWTMKSGHRFVVDGIDDGGLFHINWGWDGHYNGYYDLALLNPNTVTEPGASSSTDGYSNDNYIVYGITPDNGKKDVTSARPLVHSLGVRHQLTNGYHYLFFTYFNPYSHPVDVYLSNGYVDETGKVVKTGTAESSTLKPDTDYSQETVKSMDVSSFKDGKSYTVGLIESEDGKNWKPCEGFAHNSVTFTVKDGKVVVPERYKLSADLQIVNFNYVKQYAYGKINLKNAGERDYYDVLYLMTNSVDVNPMAYSYAAYVTAEAGDENVVDFKFVPQSDTVYYWVMDVKNNVIDKGVFYKGQDQYKLTAEAHIDTLSNGKTVCKLLLKNEGKAFYDNSVRVVFARDGGNTNVTTYVSLRAGESKVISIPLDESVVYYNFSAWDYMANQFAQGTFEVFSEDEGKVVLNISSSQMDVDGKTINSSLLITNNTSSVHRAVYNFEIDTIGNYEGELFLSQSIEVAPHSVGVIPLSFQAKKDTFYLVFYEEGSLARSRMTFITKASDVSVLDADPGLLSVWSAQGCLFAVANEDTPLVIVSVSGKTIVKRRLFKDENFVCCLPAGIYVVNGRKVIVAE